MATCRNQDGVLNVFIVSSKTISVASYWLTASASSKCHENVGKNRLKLIHKEECVANAAFPQQEIC